MEQDNRLLSNFNVADYLQKGRYSSKNHSLHKDQELSKEKINWNPG
jgi:hypothetical protein